LFKAVANILRRRQMGEKGIVLKQKGLPEQKQKELLMKMADFLGISHLLSRYPPTLSGGEQQRTALARALVVEPEILLLDEPLSALDNQSKKKMQQELHRIHKELKKTILHITHDMEEALSLGDKIGIMEQGRIIQVGPPQEVFQKPVNQFVAEFIGHDNIFRGRIDEKEGRKVVLVEGVEFYVAGGNLPAGEEGFLLLPAEGIILSPTPIKSSARNCFSGTVSTVEKRGFISIVTLDIGIPIVAKITTSSVEEMGITAGGKLFATFKATSLHFFS
jgi:molybdopterin-binding protein